MESEQEVLTEDEDSIVVDVGIAQWKAADGRYYIEKDYKVGGEVWRVHKYDPDPWPSRPHAHCIDGRERYVGCKLHLGTGELFRNGKPTGRFLEPKQFGRLLEHVQRKFPDLAFPLSNAGC